MKIWSHFKTITHHKLLVMKGCFRIGLYKQGLLHDLSKYSPTEFLVGARYYQGTRSPNAAEREAYGYSKAWMHHKGRNKHHYEYWTDLDVKTGNMAGVPMPPRYVAEMLMDRIAASRIYMKDKYTDAGPLAYYNRARERETLMHPETRQILEKLLHMLAEKGEKTTFAYIKNELLK